MKTIRHQFVEYIPETIEDGVIYITVHYRTAIHNCVCGCGNKVVTPFSPNDWKLIFNGKTISLRPSIGNWNFECRSHYWITDSEIRHAQSWEDYQKKKSIEVKERKEKTLLPKFFKKKRKSKK